MLEPTAKLPLDSYNWLNQVSEAKNPVNSISHPAKSCPPLHLLTLCRDRGHLQGQGVIPPWRIILNFSEMVCYQNLVRQLLAQFVTRLVPPVPLLWSYTTSKFKNAPNSMKFGYVVKFWSQITTITSILDEIDFKDPFCLVGIYTLFFISTSNSETSLVGA